MANVLGGCSPPPLLRALICVNPSFLYPLLPSSLFCCLRWNGEKGNRIVHNLLRNPQKGQIKWNDDDSSLFGDGFGWFILFVRRTFPSRIIPSPSPFQGKKMTAATTIVHRNNNIRPPLQQKPTPSLSNQDKEEDDLLDKNNNKHGKGATTSTQNVGREQQERRRRPTNENEEELKRFGHYSKGKLQMILPSNYAKRLLPPSLYRLCCYGSYLFWFIIGLLVLRKTRSATSAVHYVKTHGHSVSLASIENSPQFSDLLAQIDGMHRPPAILMLNQFALNMTFNFLCNTAIFPGVHERFIFVTLDSKSRDVLMEYWPQIRQFHWPTPSLYKPFSFAEGAYQTIYLFRANLAVALIKRGKSFWMQQQDTFWRRNLFEIGFEDEPGFDLLFDQIGHGNNSKRAEWVNGANFFVRANPKTQQFFEAIAAKLAHWYTPDMGIMIHQCHTWGQPVCKFIPHRIAHSWEWMYTEQREPPHVIQLDCETDGGSKLQQLARFGFHFTLADGRTCNREAVHRAQIAMEQGKVGVEGPTKLSWGRLQFKVYWWLVDYILCTPLLGPILKPYLPLIGYILMITMA